MSPLLRIAKAPLAGLALVAGLAGGALLGSPPAWAQLAVAPESVSVAVPQHETAERTVTLTNTGAEPLAFCLSFDRPLQQEVGAARLRSDALGSACGPYGEVLGLIGADEVPTPVTWSPYGLAMLPDGRLFAADFIADQTHELTPELEHVRSFAHPIVAEFEPFPVTTGLTYNADTGTLWWLNVESSGFDVYRALLLEGDLDGEPTGRRIELPIGAPDVPPDERASPVGLSYDPSRGWYYYTDTESETIWAVDTLGHVAPGYPVQMEGYPGATIARGINVVPAGVLDGAEGGPAGLRLELYVNPPGESPPRHIGVVGRYGEDTAPGAEPLETPYASDNPNAETGTVSGEAVRSVLDPNGVLYYPWGAFEDEGVVAIRPHPLPPSWLVVEAWDGTLEPGESRTLELVFRPGARTVGEYTSVLQVFEAESGEAVEVPLSLMVTEGTDAEEDAERVENAQLSVYPNPSSSDAVVSLALMKAAEVRVEVYDVLGREVAVLHEGQLGAGEHALYFDAAGSPAGLYLVRVVGKGLDLTRTITVLR